MYQVNAITVLADEITNVDECSIFNANRFDKKKNAARRQENIRTQEGIKSIKYILAVLSGNTIIADNGYY